MESSSVSHDSKRDRIGDSSAQSLLPHAAPRAGSLPPSIFIPGAGAISKSLPKAVVLPYRQRKKESIMQGRVPCKPWLCGSPCCCRQVRVTALLTSSKSHPCVGCGGWREGSQGPAHLPGVSCSRHRIAVLWQTHPNFWVGSGDPVLPSWPLRAGIAESFCARSGLSTSMLCKQGAGDQQLHLVSGSLFVLLQATQLPAALLNLGKHLLQAATILNELDFLANQKVLNQGNRLQQIPRPLDCSWQFRGETEPVQEDAVAFRQAAHVSAAGLLAWGSAERCHRETSAASLPRWVQSPLAGHGDEGWCRAWVQEGDTQPLQGLLIICPQKAPRTVTPPLHWAAYSSA